MKRKAFVVSSIISRPPEVGKAKDEGNSNPSVALRSAASVEDVEVPPGAAAVPMTNGGFTLVSLCDLKFVQGLPGPCRRDHHNRPERYSSYANLRIKVDGKWTYRALHTLLCERAFGRRADYPREHTDHINGNGLDNRRDNLRIVTAQQNSWNTKAETAGTSSYKGVHWNTEQSLWQAQIMPPDPDLPQKRIGSYVEEEDAARAYDWFAIHYFGPFARTNFSPVQPPSEPSSYKFKRQIRGKRTTRGTWARSVDPHSTDLHGVVWMGWAASDGRWGARLYSGSGRHKHIGCFVREKDAGLAYDAFVRENGLGLPLNFPDEAVSLKVLKATRPVASHRAKRTRAACAEPGCEAIPYKGATFCCKHRYAEAAG